MEAIQNRDSIEQLLISGHDPNDTTSWISPIVVAIEMGDQAAVECLMRYGASVFAPHEDVAVLAIKNPIMVWTILKHATLTVTHHIFSTMHRLGKEKLMIEFIMKGYADCGFNFSYRPHIHVCPWKSISNTVRNVFVDRNRPWSRKRHYLFSSDFKSVLRTFCLCICRLRESNFPMLPTEMVEAIFEQLPKF